MESYKIGRVKVTQIAPKIFKLNMTGFWWYSGIHIEKTIVELSKKYKILGVVHMNSWLDYRLVIVE